MLSFSTIKRQSITFNSCHLVLSKMSSPSFSISHVWVTLLFILLTLLTSSAEASDQKPTLQILPHGKSLSRPSNQMFVLTCKGQGDSNLLSHLSWYTPQSEEINKIYMRDKNPDFQVLTADGSLILYFKNPKPDLSGTYKCRGVLQQSDYLESEININIYEDVTFDHCPEVQYLIKGNVGERINCRASANPKPNIIWAKDSEQLDNNPKYFINSSGIAIKEAVTDSDGGVFQINAVVTETGATHEKRITVQIYSRPQIEKMPDVVEGVEDEQVEMHCEASGVPQPLYTWLDANRRNLSSVGGYAVDRNTGSIIISRAKRIDDKGNFTCIAENSAGKSERSTKLIINLRPKIRSFLNVSYPQNNVSYMECRATGDPMPLLTIRKDGLLRPFQNGDARIKLDEKFEKDEKILLLTYLATTRKDDGLYYCRAENKAGISEMTGHLEVKFMPDMSLTPMTKVKTWDNRPINMTCIADAIPNATIKWFKNGNEIFENEIYRISDNGAGMSKLFIKPTGMAYDSQAFGTYRCEGANALGKGFVNIDLERATVPGLVSDVKAIEITPTQIRFKIFSDLFDGGMPIKQTYVEYYNRNDPSDRNIKKFPYSKLENVYIIDKLKPYTHYRFRFSAENEVGKGEYGQEIQIQTKDESRPDKPEFHNLPYDPINKDEIISPYSHKFTAMWNLPPDNGRKITYFEIKYYQIRKTESGYTALTEPIIDRISYDPMTSHTLQKLKANSYYRIELRAHNELGFSNPADIIFKTPQTSELSGEEELSMNNELNVSSTIPVGLITGIIIISIIFLLLIMDIVFYIRYKVGAIYFLRTHICNIGNEDENKLNNFSPSITASDISSRQQQFNKYQNRSSASLNRNPIETKHTVEVDNPAFDNVKSNPEERSPMLNGGERERFGGYRRDHDSVV